MKALPKSPVLVGVAAVAAAAVVLRMYDPANSGIFPPCPLHYLTGLYCPGCGSLRAMHQLLQGNWQAAWAMNPLTCILLPFLIYGLASEMLGRVRGRGLPQVFLPAVSIRVLCALIILFGIVRNFPIPPFDLLAPVALRTPGFQVVLGAVPFLRQSSQIP